MWDVAASGSDGEVFTEDAPVALLHLVEWLLTPVSIVEASGRTLLDLNSWAGQRHVISDEGHIALDEYAEPLSEGKIEAHGSVFVELGRNAGAASGISE